MPIIIAYGPTNGGPVVLETTDAKQRATYSRRRGAITEGTQRSPAGCSYRRTPVRGSVKPSRVTRDKGQVFPF